MSLSRALGRFAAFAAIVAVMKLFPVLVWPFLIVCAVLFVLWLVLVWAAGVSAQGR